MPCSILKILPPPALGIEHGAFSSPFGQRDFKVLRQSLTKWLICLSWPQTLPLLSRVLDLQM